MNIEQAYDKLSEYADGGLTQVERLELERLLDEQPELREALMVSMRMDQSLRAQVWLEPSVDFTRRVLLQVELSKSPLAPVMHSGWERVKAAVSAAALLGMLVFYGKSLALTCTGLLSDAGSRVGTFTGYSLFALHPVILLGLLAPLLAGGYATCVLTGRCRLTS